MRGIGMKTTVTPLGVVLPKKTFLNTSVNQVTPAYFDTMGMPLLAGRGLDVSDAGRQPAPVVVNQAFADLFFPRENPVGKVLAHALDTNKPVFVIAGVTVTAKYRSMREPDPPTVYSAMDLAKSSARPLVMYVRVRDSAGSVVAAVREIIAKLDPGVPLVEVFTLEQEIQTSLWQERLVAMLAVFFGVVSVLLAGIGLYGTLTYSVAQRTHELGIRVAVGARFAHIVRTVCSPIAMAVACGLVGGAIAAALLLRLTERLLFGVRPSKPVY
jgi:ABC-type antimicrobial peptide transport system permease subunit